MKYSIQYIFLIIIFLIAMLEANAVEGPPKIDRICNQSSGNTIYWNNSDDFCASFEILYIYYRESPDDDFKILDSMYDYNSVQTYFHQGGGRNYEYFIKINYDCSFLTPLYSDTVAVNISRPDQGKFDSVSIVNDQVVLGWKAVQNDIFGYVIYYVNNQGDNIIIDTLYGKDNSFYIDSVRGNPGVNAEKYRFAAFDSCYNISAISNSHQTIHLKSNVDACNNKVSLNWNEYTGWDDGVKHYIIYIKNIDTTDSFTAIDTVLNAANDYEVRDLQGGYEYCFKIRAYSNDSDFTSSTNEICIDANFIIRPEVIYLKNVTTNKDNGNIVISWYIDIYDDIKKINIYRGFDSLNMYQISTVVYNGTMPDTYTDENVNTNDSIYYYRIEPVDFCDNKLSQTYASSNILLNVKYDADKNRELNWNTYYGWDANVDYYRIFRTNTLTNPYIWSEIATKTPDDYFLIYTDEDIIDEYGNNGICYYIEAVEKIANQYGFRERSISNISCMVEDPLVYIPNAFSPTGKNIYFNVQGLFIDFENSFMRIYDRWGSLRYETNNIKQGWDGRTENNGPTLPEGAYLYFIRIYGINGVIKDYHGTINLLK